MECEMGHDDLSSNLFQIYAGRSEIIWTHLICSNSITFRLNIKTPASSTIPLLGLYIAAVSSGASEWHHGQPHGVLVETEVAHHLMRP
jgi:hypothetical protein